METTVWYCDDCSREIVKPSDGLVIWAKDDDRMRSAFRIVHQHSCDPDSGEPWGHLHHMLGHDGQQKMLAWLSIGRFHDHEEDVPRVSDMDGFVDLYRRLHTPGYEEARRFFWSPEVRNSFSGLHEYAPYTQNVLKQIIELGADVDQ